MSTILLVEDAPDLGTYEAYALEAEGHRVLRCGGAPTPLAACPMMRGRPCPLAEAADVIVFSCGLVAPVAGRSYRGVHLLRAYREHRDYGRKPMLVVSVGMPQDLGGSGPLRYVEKFSAPDRVIQAVERLAAMRRHPSAPRRGSNVG